MRRRKLWSLAGRFESPILDPALGRTRGCHYCQNYFPLSVATVQSIRKAYLFTYLCRDIKIRLPRSKKRCWKDWSRVKRKLYNHILTILLELSSCAVLPGRPPCENSTMRVFYGQVVCTSTLNSSHSLPMKAEFTGSTKQLD